MKEKLKKRQRKVKQCAMCGKRVPENNWRAHWQKHPGEKERELFQCKISDDTIIRGKPWREIEKTIMNDSNFKEEGETYD